MPVVKKIYNPYQSKNFINAEVLLQFIGSQAESSPQTRVNLGQHFGISFNQSWSIELIVGISQADINEAVTDTPATWNLILGNIISPDDVGISITLTKTTGSVLRFRCAFANVSAENLYSIPISGMPGLYHIVITFDNTTKESSIFVNGIASDPLVVTYDFSVTNNFFLGDRPSDPNTRSWRGQIGLIRFYNETLIRQDIIRLLRFPYVVSSELHIHITAEYIPQRSYFRDINNLYGFGANAIIWFDTSEQYNYVKGMPINATHGVLSEWSTNEVVLYPHPANVFSFYADGKKKLGKGLYKEHIDSSYLINTGDTLNLDTENFSILSYSRYDGASFFLNNRTTSMILESRSVMGSFGIGVFYVDNRINTGATESGIGFISRNSDNSRLGYIESSNRLVTMGEKATLGFHKITEDALNWKLSKGGDLNIPTTITDNTLLPADAIQIKDPCFGARESSITLKGVLGEIVVFQPELSQAQLTWIIDVDGSLKDPTTSEAKSNGIGIEGTDTIGVTGITTLIKRRWLFDSVFENGATYYIREEITNNDNYASLINFTSPQDAIGNF